MQKYTKLAINLLRDNAETVYLLINDSFTIGTRLLSDNDLLKVKCSEWFSPILNNESINSLIAELNDNQLMTTIFFYLKTQTNSRELMQQWFMDVECTPQTANLLADQLYLSRFAKPDYEPEFLSDLESLNTTVESVVSDLESLNTTVESVELSTLLYRMQSDHKLLWAFDNMPTSETIPLCKKINLAGLRESSFIIEDHSCIVIGFSVTYTCFIEIVSGYKPHLLKNLSQLVPLGQRDIHSIGRLFIEYPEISNLIIQSGFSSINLMGLSSTGTLTEFKTLRYDSPILPLYLKLNK